MPLRHWLGGTVAATVLALAGLPSATAESDAPQPEVVTLKADWQFQSRLTACNAGPALTAYAGTSYGNETIVTMKLSDQFRIKGGLANTRAVFREGPFAGNDVPLVSHWTGNIGVSWDVWKNMTLDVVNRYFSPKRMDNDQLNNQPMIPSYNLVDVRLGGQIEQFFWSVAVLNLFNVQYFDYAMASPYPEGPGSLLGTYNAYPLPGRTVLLRLGRRF